MNNLYIHIVRLNAPIKKIAVAYNNIPDRIEEDGDTYYLNSIHRGDRCPGKLNKTTTGCWYAPTPSKGINSFTPVYLPPFI